MDVMLARANQGLLSTAINIERLWNQHLTDEIEVKRLEMELGNGGDHEIPFSWNQPVSGAQLLAWTKLLGKCARDEIVL
jgi:hypothetical protein